MTTKNSSPRDLASFVLRKLRNKKISTPIPKKEILVTLFETLFYASLKTEESRLINVTITLMDPENPDPNPHPHRTLDRWQYIRFNEVVPLNVRNLVKISKSADPWSSSLAVYYDRMNQLYIWGMVDQALHYQTFLNYELDFEPEKPGILQITINGIGNISVILDYELIANLKQNSLISRYLNIFSFGLIAKK